MSIIKGENMVTTVENIKIDSKLLKTIVEMAERENTTKAKILNKIIKKGIEHSQTRNKIPEYLITNKNRIPDPEGLDELIGIIDAPYEDFDPVEAVREVRRGD